jgi:MDMPI C-terminal domain
VRECGPDTAVWTWRADRTSGFWLRKLVHDGLVHRLDAELTIGRDGPVPADLAADGVTDLLLSVEALSPPDSADPVFVRLCGNGQTLHVHATDPGLGAVGEWLVRRTPAGVSWEQRHGAADVTVRGPARGLLLVLNRRIRPDLGGIEVVGDINLFAHWLDHSAF